MPLYLITITHGESEYQNEGIELQDDEAAWKEATTACGEMIRDLDGKLKSGQQWRMVVKRESGDVVFRLSFSAEGPF
jgi:hypothetical protein